MCVSLKKEVQTAVKNVLGHVWRMPVTIKLDETVLTSEIAACRWNDVQGLECRWVLFLPSA